MSTNLVMKLNFFWLIFIGKCFSGVIINFLFAWEEAEHVKLHVFHSPKLKLI